MLSLKLPQTVLGISLGASCFLRMTPDETALPGRRPLDILLPRRSIYILSGSARYSPGWQNGINSVGVGSEQVCCPAGQSRLHHACLPAAVPLRSTCNPSAPVLLSQMPLPSWNPESVRRSITMRSSIIYSMVLLQREKSALPAGAEAQRASLHQRLQLLHSKGLHPGAEKGWGCKVTRAAHLRRTVLASNLAAGGNC
jgi:hypothetical protein